MPPVNELPVKQSRISGRGTGALNRRQALGVLASGIASGLAACSKPDQQIIPYVKLPERVVPGEPLKWNTASVISRGVENPEISTRKVVAVRDSLTDRITGGIFGTRISRSGAEIS